MFIVPLYMLQDGINIGKGPKVLIVFFKVNNVFSVQIHSNYANQGTMCANEKDPLSHICISIFNEICLLA